MRGRRIDLEDTLRCRGSVWARRGVVGLTCFLVAQTALWACPTCGDGLFDPEGAAAQARVLKGYAVSIVALLGLPLVMIGAITALVVRSSRRAKRS